ncbi:uncharacterized protein JN550_013291 [Neoarthrinium moseri]|uniref:uncharacterized protein n=1 Tax=Neoarthrinium moseri TaxID=1658444 RepID=UPI001FDB19D4|nr:uncharacterized protein JN550_013291 [Neoarthrinium moseri]KAI1857311.1 hypothetical protein JN550_013291 [Neoarthrinium moseri]
MAFAPHWFAGPDGDPVNGRGRVTNTSLTSLGKPGYMYPWAFKIYVLAYKFETDESEVGFKATFIDVEMKDYLHVVDWFLNHPLNPCISDTGRTSVDMLPAIKINSLTDCYAFELGKYNEVNVRSAVYRREYQWPSPLAFMVGLPWICRMTASTNELFRAHHNTIFDQKLLENPEARVLAALYYDSAVDSEGEPILRAVPPNRCLSNIKFQANPGTVMIMHINGACILIEHVKVFTDFMDLIMNLSAGFNHVNKAMFQFHWDTRKRLNDVKGLDLTNIPSPYKMSTSILGRGNPVFGPDVEMWRKGFEKLNSET